MRGPRPGGARRGLSPAHRQCWRGGRPMTRFVWGACVLAVANACRDAPSREQKLPNGVLAETKYVRAAAEEGTNAKAEWYDAGKQTRTLFRQLLDSGTSYTTTVLKPQLLRASRGFTVLYPATD